MAHPSTLPRPSGNGTATPRRGRIRRKVRSIWHEAPLWVHIVIVAAGALLAMAVVFISANWPYRHRKIAPMLEDVLACDVTFTGYHRTYFPRPGFMATGITMRRKSARNLPPLGHVDSMLVEGTWSDLVMLRQRVELVDITGLRVTVPAIGSKENHEDFPPGSATDFEGPDTMIERFVVHKSLLEILRKDGKPLSFPIKQLEIRNLHKGEALTYAVDMQNAVPTGHILAHGSMGPAGKDFLATPINGNFAYTNVNLHDVGDIHGTLDTRGVFKGTLRSMDVETSAESKNFAVDDGRPTPLSATMQSNLSGDNGDMDIHSIDVKIGATNIHTVGSIKGNPKASNLDISVDNGRAQDIMAPFVTKEVPITGPVWIKSHAYLGPPGDGFKERLRVTGTFDVPKEKLTDEKTEKSLSAFSERARGDHKPNTGVDSDGKPPDTTKDVLSSIRGPVKIENWVASSPRLTFEIAGAQATLAGTFRFHGEVAHLTGNLKMDTDISHTATGFKSFLLKPLAPFFRKKNAGAVVPIAVTGTPGHYNVTQNITHNK